VSVIVWVADAGWPEAVDAALAHSPSFSEVVLLHVTPGEAGDVAHGGFATLLGRGRREADPPAAARIAGEQDADAMLAGAADRAGNRLVTVLRRTGRPEREVVAASVGAELLVIARDDGGLSPMVRFVVEHATCPLLLVRRSQL
jgi:nucleotide-binding universal stress UspA family protein